MLSKYDTNPGINGQTGGLNRREIDLKDTSRQDQPDYPSAAYLKMKPRIELVSDVYAGTLRLRELGKKYLPKFPLESEESYNDRLSAACLMNQYARTVDAMVGLVVGEGVKVKNFPKEFETHLLNIDNAGTSFEVFARDTLRDAFDGHTVVLVDMAQPDTEIRNHAELQTKRSQVRPYWRRYKAEDILSWRSILIDGELVLKQIVFKECTGEPVGDYGEKQVVRYRRWYLRQEEITAGVFEWRAAWQVWVKTEETETVKGKKKKTEKFRLEKENEKPLPLTRIPIFSVYGNKVGFLESSPPLVDLALKNIEHFQLDSNYKKGLSIAGIAVPVFKLKGGDSEGEAQKAFGWDKGMELGPEDDFSFAEASGAALPNHVTALDTVKNEMSVLGLSLIAQRADTNITATERLLDSVQQSNQLMAIQADLLRGLRQGLVFHLEWTDEAEKSKNLSVALGLDWTELVRAADSMQMILEMFKEDGLSTETMLEAAVRYGILPKYVDPLEEIERLSKEGRKRKSLSEMKATGSGVEVSKGGKGADKMISEKTDREKSDASVSKGLDKKDEDAVS